MRPSNVPPRGGIAPVAAFDLGLAHCGYAHVDLYSYDTNRADLLRDLGAWSTKKSDKKQGVLASDDDFRRARELAGEMVKFLDHVQPVAVVVEAKSLPRNSSSACLIGMAWGVLATEVQRRALPVVQSSPQHVRKALGLKGTASKPEIRGVVFSRFGNAGTLLERSGLAEGVWEHGVDAAAAVLACLPSDVLRLARTMAR